MLKSTGRYSEKAFCITGLIELLYFPRILSFSKDILIFSSTILTKNSHSLVPLSSPLSPVLYPIYLVWWSRIGDTVVVRLLPYHRKHKLEFSFDFFIHSINCRCWLISQSQLVILSLTWSTLRSCSTLPLFLIRCSFSMSSLHLGLSFFTRKRKIVKGQSWTSLSRSWIEKPFEAPRNGTSNGAAVSRNEIARRRTETSDCRLSRRRRNRKG